MKRLFTIMLFAAMLFPWMAKSQSTVTMASYDVNVGIDSTRWIALDASASQLLGARQDDEASAVTNIGFTFNFGGTDYTQFSVSSNGGFTFGSTAAGDGTGESKLSNSTGYPKIAGIAKDLGTCTGGYIKYQVVGTAPSRVLVVEYKTGHTYTSTITADVTWQVQLHETSNRATIVYGPTPTTVPSSFEIGAGISINDYIKINPNNHLATHYTASNTTSYSTWPGAYRFYEFYIPTCFKPTNLGAFTTQEDAVLSWTDNNSASQWIVEYDTAGFTQGTGNIDVVNTTSYTITGLTANTAYDFYVKAVCSSSDSSSWSYGSFRTTCYPYNDTFPYIESFETYTASSALTANIDFCWHRVQTMSTTANYPYVSTTVAATGSKSLYMNGSATGYSCIVLPEFEDSFSDLQLSFKMYRNSTSYTSPIMVGIMTNRDSISTFDTLAIFTCQNNSVWEYVEVPLSSYTGTGTFIAISTCPGIATNCYIDDITVSEIGTCPAPVGVVATNVTGTSADIVWNDDINSSWIVEYGPVGFSLGSGTVEYATSPSLSLFNLTSATGYDVYVRADCSDTTSNVVRITFRTSCAEYLEVPFTDNFDSYGFGSAVRPQCWIYGGYNASYPQISASQKASGVASAYMYVTRPSTPDSSVTYWTYMVAPQVDVSSTPINTLQVSFKQRATSLNNTTYPGTVVVGVVSDTADIAGTFYPIDTLRSSTNTAWEEFDVSLINYPIDSTGSYIAIASIPVPASATTSSLYNYIYIDDFKIDFLPSCTRPQDAACIGVGSTTATIYWDDPDINHTAWDIAYGPEGFNPDSIEVTQIGTIEAAYGMGGSDSATIQNLNPGMVYHFYVRTNCGGEYSEWRGPVVATPGSMNIPATGMASTSGCSVVLYDNGGPDDVYTNNNSGYVVVYPGAQDSLVALMAGNYHTESSYDKISIYDGVGVYGTLLAQYTGTGTITDTIVSTTGPLTVHFYSDGSTVYEGFMLRLGCVEAPSCPTVQDIEVSEIAGRSAYLTWGYSSGSAAIPASYEIEVTDALGNVDVITTTETHYLLSGLEGVSTYKVRIKAICDDSESVYDSVFFTTECVSGGEIEISGATQSTSYYIPVNNLYDYTYSQQLVLASEMGGPGTLRSIAFEYDYSSAMTEKTNVSIYLGHTSASSMSSTAWQPTTNAQLVYTGSLNCTSRGWNEFEFSTPFVYNGTDNLVVTVVDNSGDYNSSSYVFKVHSATGKTLQHHEDGSMTVPPDAADISTYNYRNNMKFAGDCDTVVICAGPNVVVTDVTPYQIDIVWAAGDQETSWNVEYRVAGDSVWTVAATATSATSYSLTNLMSSTDYEVNVVSLCGAESRATTKQVHTPCADISDYPFFENFDSWTTGSSSNLPACWQRLTNNSTSYPYVSTSYSLSRNKSMYFYAYTSYYSALVLPKFNLPVDTMVVEFAVYKGSASYQGLQVGVMTDPNDISTFTPVGIANPSATSTWEHFQFYLNSYNGEDGYIAIVAPMGSSNYPYLDNVEVYPIPTCYRPTNVAVDAASITLNSAVITWTDTLASSWMIEYGPRGFVPGTGTTDNASSTTYTFQGLDHSTQYDVYVYALCSATDTSYPSHAVSFSTLCGTIDNLPFYEDFAGYETGSGSTIPHYPHCWAGHSDYSSSYPYISSGIGIEGVSTNYEYLYCYAAAANLGTKYTYLALPAVDSVQYQMTDLMVSFYTKAGSVSSTYDARLYVGIATDPADPNTYVAIDTIERTNTSWEEISELEFSSYTGNGKYIVFWVCPQTASYSSFYVDNIEVDVIPTCRRPQDLHIVGVTGSSATLAWTERNNATSWVIEYDTVGFELGTGTTVVANSNPFTVTGLNATTEYEFRVKSTCSSSDESRFSRTISGWTSQIAANVPYAYDFENVTEWNNWASISNRDTVKWFRGTATAAQGTNAMYISKDAGATNSTVSGTVNATAYRDFDFGANDTNFTVTFKAKAGGRIDGAYDGLMLYLVDPSVAAVSSNTALNTPWGNINNNPPVNGLFVRLDTVFNEYAVELDAVSGVKRLAFYYFNQTFADSMFVGDPAAVDDINIVYTTCPRPTNVAATNINANSATITWGGSASGYYVYYRGVDQQSIDSVYTTSNSIVLSGLNSNTNYLLAVKSVCGNEMSIFSSTIEFYTTQILAQLPYYCGFEANESEASQWTMMNGNATNGWCVGTATADSGSASLYVTNDFTNKPNTYTITSSSVSWAFRDFYFPPIPATDTFEINFRWRCAGEGSYDHMRVYIGPAIGVPTAGATSTVTAPDSATLLATELQDRYDDEGAASGYVTERIILSGAEYGGGNYRIYLCWKNDGSVGEQPPASVDEFQIFSPVAGCVAPIVNAVPTSTDAVLTFDAAGNYDVAYKAVSDAVWSDDIHVLNVSSYTITGLSPETNYEYRVRRYCDETTISNWTMGSFMTEELPCMAPTAITASNIEMTSATISWTSATTSQEAWQVAYGYGNDASAWDTIMVTAATANLTGLYANTQYTVYVKGYCSVESDIYSDWSEPFTFSTAACAIPTNVTASNVTASAATITWSAAAGQTKWQISYGFEGVNEENGIIVNVEGTPSYTLEGLDYETTYDVYVRAICADGIYSAWTPRAQFTTDPIGINTASNDDVSVRIYPNPANAEATITVEGISGKVEFVVADMNGRMIVTETIACEGSLVKSIDVSNLTKGAYFVHIYNDNFNTTRKLIVK